MGLVAVTPSLVFPGSETNVFTGGTADVEIEAGTFVCEILGEWHKVDADNASTVDPSRVFGIALNHAYAGQKLAVTTRDDALELGGGLTGGTTYYASGTAGVLCLRSDLVPGQFVLAVGTANDSSTLAFNVIRSLVQVP